MMLFISILLIALSLPLHAAQVRIYRDTWGVAHIYATTPAEAMHGFAYAQAEDRLESILKNYRIATGHMAEIFGPDHIDNDFQQRLWRHEILARQRYDTLAPDVRLLIESFLAGIVAFMRDHPNRVPSWAKEPQPYHVIALARYIAFHTLELQAENEYTRQSPAYNAGNQWAASPKRSADNTALLCMDPFAVWHDTFRWYEAHLHGGDLNAFGFAVPGLPIFGVGHNQFLGWSALPGGSDAADVYEIALDSPITNRYRFDHAWRPITTDSLNIGVRINNTIEYHIRRYQQTHHGPILHRNNTHAYAYRFSLANEIGQIEQHYRMMTAADLKTFYAALQLAQSGPQRIVYADMYGNIAFLHTGRVPIRSEFHTWHRPVSGNTSDTEWQGIHTQDDLLQIHNPPAGWLQDCDALPGQHTIPDPFTPDRYQTYIVNMPENESPRASRMRSLLAASSRITLSEAIAFSQDTYIIHSENWIRALNIALANQNRTDLVQALTILNHWNGRADRETSGMAMYALWRKLCRQEGRAPNTAHILSSQPPGGITTKILIDAFSETAAHLQTTYNRLNITYKEIQRFRQNDHSWPLAGSSGPGLTALRATHTTSNQYINDGISGPSCTTIVSFHPSNGITSHSVVPFGQSNIPASPHHTDQAEHLFSQERLKPTHFGISPSQLKLQHTLQMP